MLLFKNTIRARVVHDFSLSIPISEFEASPVGEFQASQGHTVGESKHMHAEPSMMALTCNPSTGDAREARSS